MEKNKEKTNINAFKESKIVTNKDFVKKILNDVTGINLTEQEVSKLKVYLNYEASGTLFSSINHIYSIIGGNFSNPSRFLVIPFIIEGREHINIQKI